jgi:hypothetical protein
MQSQTPGKIDSNKLKLESNINMAAMQTFVMGIKSKETTHS